MTLLQKKDWGLRLWKLLLLPVLVLQIITPRPLKAQTCPVVPEYAPFATPRTECNYYWFLEGYKNSEIAQKNLKLVANGNLERNQVYEAFLGTGLTQHLRKSAVSWDARCRYIMTTDIYFKVTLKNMKQINMLAAEICNITKRSSV